MLPGARFGSDLLRKRRCAEQQLLLLARLGFWLRVDLFPHAAESLHHRQRVVDLRSLQIEIEFAVLVCHLAKIFDIYRYSQTIVDVCRNAEFAVLVCHLPRYSWILVDICLGDTCRYL